VNYSVIVSQVAVCSSTSQNFGSNYALFFITVVAISLHHIHFQCLRVTLGLGTWC